MRCSNDVLNPCWDDRAGDVPGKHWGGGPACTHCTLRAILALLLKRENNELWSPKIAKVVPLLRSLLEGD